MEIKDVTKTALFAVTDPALITVNMDDLAKRQKENNTKRDAQPVRTEGPAGELQKLRRELFNLTERAKGTEIHANNQAGTLKLLESQLADALKAKKAAVVSGNAVHERACEHTITRLEREKADAEKEFNRAHRVSAGAANDLKNWPHHERVEELQELVVPENDHK